MHMNTKYPIYMAAKGQCNASKKKRARLLPRAWSLVATAPDRVRYKASLVPFGLADAGAFAKVLTGKSEEKTFVH